METVNGVGAKSRAHFVHSKRLEFVLFRHRRKLAGVLAVLAMAGVTGPAQAGPAPGQAAPGPIDTVLANRTHTVTLLTGDVVTVTATTGRCPQISVRPARPGRVLSKSCGPDGHVRVVPAESAGLVGRTLDPALFDVTALIDNGYDDARTAELPLIVKHAPGRGATALTSGLVRRRGLASLGSVAGRHPKKSGLRDLSGVSHVWLDRRVRASALDAPVSALARQAPGVAGNLTQVGAPRAWAAGYTGAGVRVAVLDSGVDATHPDLAGRIAASEDFTGTGDPTDRFGHGTHVAAIVAGSGAASGGTNRGVAPDARLLVGKVLDDFGFGTDSQVIAGMEWAAPRASVVNMSLGGDFTDGTDPLSQALDALTGRHGTLFVVAAGNSGPIPTSISTPASAASALAVGAVDGADTLAPFSGRGPVTGNHTLKPEIVAPGVDIVSARAAGTGGGDPVDDRYTRLSGTSMAAPHVAGAAAILRQRHPDWAADRLKSALTGAAEPAHGGDAYQVGAGRLAIPPALSTMVGRTAVANFGTFSFPQSGTATTTVTWTNTGTTESTLRLALAVADRGGRAVPDGSVRLSASTLTVPAGGSGSVTITADRGGLAARPDDYSGILTARAGDATVRTPVAFFVEPPSHDLTIRATALPGTPADAAFWDAFVMNLDDVSRFEDFRFGAVGEVSTVRVPAGRYSVLGDVYDDSPSASRVALAGTAEVTVAGPTTVVLDAARARPVTARVTGVDTKAQQVGIAAVQAGRLETGRLLWLEPSAFGAEAARWPVYSTPIRGVDVGFLHLTEVFSLRAPGDGPSPFMYELVRALPDGVPTDPSYLVSAQERDRLARIDQRFYRLDAPGTHTGHNRKGGREPEGFFVFENSTDEVPATRVDYLTPGIPWNEKASLEGDSALARFPLTDGPLRVFTPGSRQSQEALRQPLRVDWYDDPVGPRGCSPAPIRRTRGNLHVDLATLVDQHQRFNCVARFWSSLQLPAPSLTLYRDGRRIGSASAFTADFPIPAAAGTYRLIHDQDASAVLPISTRVTTEWTFRSTGPAGDASAPVPLFALDYALPLDLDNHPVDGEATFTVRQSNEVPEQRITSARVWTSIDNAATWQPATVRTGAGGSFSARLPVLAPGQAMSLRVSASGSGGSGIDQTIIRAYRA